LRCDLRGASIVFNVESQAHPEVRSESGATRSLPGGRRRGGGAL